MTELAFSAEQLTKLRQALAHPRLESAAILLAAPVARRDRGGQRLLVHDMAIPGEDDYQIRTRTAVELKPAFGLSYEKAAAQRGWSLIYCHTHPFTPGMPSFSRTDTEAEVGLARYALGRSPNATHVALLLGAEQLAARELGTQTPVRVLSIGPDITPVFDPLSDTGELETAHNRQILAFGEVGQRRLQRLRVVIVGLGGTGSVLAQQLAFLGIDDFILVDPQIIDETNLNRVVGAVKNDVGRTLKVDVAKRVIRSIRPGARITKLACDILQTDVARSLLDADFMFSCTDSHGSRSLLNQIAYQYLLPTIDVGVAITPNVELDDLEIWAHARMLAPGLACLHCEGVLDPDEVRRDFMSETQRRADPYFNRAAGVSQPAVISLTSMAVSAATTMFLSAVVGIPAPPRYVTYWARHGRMKQAVVARVPSCPYCRDAAVGAGNLISLPERQDE